MRLLGELSKKEVVTKCTRRIEKIVCDKCGKELTGFFAKVTTGHYRWGNDSADSIKYFDLCFDCARMLFYTYSSEPSETDYFDYEVEHASYCEDRPGTDAEVNSDGEPYFSDLHKYKRL